jgi:hypothetical protein
MFVSNLAQHPLGVDGIVILKPGEQNRFIEETPDLVERVKRLESVGLATVRFEAGLEKNGLPLVTETKIEAPVEEVKPVEDEPVEKPADVEPTDVEEEPAAKPKRGGRGAK